MSICDETEIQIIQIAILFFLFVYNKLEKFPRRNFAYNDPPPSRFLRLMPLKVRSRKCVLRSRGAGMNLQPGTFIHQLRCRYRI